MNRIWQGCALEKYDSWFYSISFPQLARHATAAGRDSNARLSWLASFKISSRRQRQRDERFSSKILRLFLFRFEHVGKRDDLSASSSYDEPLTNLEKRIRHITQVLMNQSGEILRVRPSFFLFKYLPFFFLVVSGKIWTRISWFRRWRGGPRPPAPCRTGRWSSSSASRRCSRCDRCACREGSGPDPRSQTRSCRWRIWR